MKILFWKKLTKRQKLYYELIIGALLIIAIPFIISTLRTPTKSEAAWYNDSWKYRKQLFFNNSAQAENLINFPVMISLTSSNFDFNNTNSDGSDVRFTDSDGKTLLKYDIESYSKTNQQAVIWVKVPQIDASSTTDFIYIYYGNANTTDAQDPTNVWSSNTLGRWHLKETTLNNGSPLVDSSTNAENLQVVSGGTSITGMNDGAISFSSSQSLQQKVYSSQQSTVSVTSTTLVDTGQNFTPWSTGSARAKYKVVIERAKAKLKTQSQSSPTGTITGASSGATATIDYVTSSLGYIEVSNVTGSFWPGETVNGTGGSAVLRDGYMYVPNTVTPNNGDAFSGVTSGATAVVTGKTASGSNWKVTYRRTSATKFTNAENVTFPGPTTVTSSETIHQDNPLMDLRAAGYIGNVTTNNTAPLMTLPSGGSSGWAPTFSWTQGVYANDDYPRGSSGPAITYEVYKADFDRQSNLTMNFWAKAGYGRTIMKGRDDEHGNVGGGYGLGTFNTNRLRPANPGGQNDYTISVGSASWNLITIVYQNNNSYSTYLNGALVATNSYTPSSVSDTSIIKSNYSVFYGEDYYTGNTGVYDEAEITTDVWDAAWVAAEYLSLNNTFITYALSENGPKYLDPIAYWKFDEGVDTTAYDSTTNKNNGTLSGTTKPSWQSDSQCISGKCLYFDGVTSYIDAGNGASLKPTSAITVEAWVKAGSTANTYQFIVDKYDSSGTARGYSMFIYQNGDWGLRFYPNGNLTITGHSIINDNKWHHIAFSADSSNIYGYLDGILIGQTTSGASDASAVSVQIGTRGGANFFKGFIDDVKIYPYARTAAQIKSDYASRGSIKGVSTSMGNNDLSYLSNGLVGWWRMDEATWSGTLGEVVDSSGNASHGQAQGATSAKAYPTGGKFGNGGYFDGVDDYVSLGSNVVMSGSGSSISFWFKANAFGDVIIGKDSDNDTYILPSDSTTIAVQTDANGTVKNFTVPTMSTGTWYHLVVTRNNNTTRVYLNGAESSSGGQTQTPGLTINQFARYSNSYPGYWYNGSLDDVRIYNRALSPAEVSQLYNWAPGPVGYWNFEEGQGGTVYDRGASSSASLNNGTWNGTGKPHYTTGKYGWAGNFNGTNDSVGSITDQSYLRLNNDFSLSFWAKRRGSGTGGYQRVVDKGPAIASGAGWTLFWDTSLLYYKRDNNHLSFGAMPEEWTYYSITNSGSTQLLYKNGTRVANYSLTFATNTDSTLLSFGGISGAYISGNIDEVRVYNYARTQKQIISDMNAGGPSVGSPVGSAVGYWKFDEGYGTTANNSGNGGTTLNGAFGATSAAPAWTNDGKIGKALNFDNINDYVQVLDNTALDITGDITLSAWVKTAEIGNGAIIGKWKASNKSYWLGLVGGSSLRMYVAGDGSTDVYRGKASSGVNNNVWHHVTATYSTNQTINIYIDGKQQTLGETSGTIPTSLYSGSGNLQIGRDEQSGDAIVFNGLIDEVKVYSYALTADEVKTEYNRGSSLVLGSLSDTSGLTGGSVASNSASAAYCVPGDTTSCNPPVGEWNFDENSGPYAYDTSGNSNNGTWNGTGNPHWALGKAGSAGKFNGSGDKVNIPDPSSGVLDFGSSSNFTVAAWAKIQNPTAYHSILGKCGQDNTCPGYEFFIQNATIFFRMTWTGGPQWGTSITATYDIRDNQWHQLAAVVNRTNSKVYLYGDGKVLNPSGGDISSVGDVDNSYPLTIGTAGAGDWKGQIDQVRIFNYARTPAQIAWDYNRGGPVGWWKFDECQGDKAYDASNPENGTWGGNNGTISIGATGDQSVLGTCTTPTDGTGAWYDGRNGKYSSSMSLDGIDDWVNLGTPANLSFVSTDFSACSWVYPTSNTGYRAIINKGDGSTAAGSQYELLSSNNGNAKFSFDVFIGANNDATTDLSTHNTNQWYFVCGVRSGSINYLYVNAVQKASNTYSGSLNNAGSIGIGAAGDGSPLLYAGQLDDMKIFNYALTAVQIKTLYGNGAVNFGPATGSP